MAALSTTSTVTTDADAALVADQHFIFSIDPRRYLQLVHCRVRVCCAERRIYEGWLYTVDPVTESLVLLQEESNGCVLVAGHAIVSVTMLDAAPEAGSPRSQWLMQRFERCASMTAASSSNDVESVASMNSRRNCLLEWLLRHRLPVEVRHDQLVMGDVLVIKPPYAVDDCFSTNMIVLDRIQDLIKNMPLHEPTP